MNEDTSALLVTEIKWFTPACDVKHILLYIVDDTVIKYVV